MRCVRVTLLLLLLLLLNKTEKLGAVQSHLLCRVIASRPKRLKFKAGDAAFICFMEIEKDCKTSLYVIHCFLG